MMFRSVSIGEEALSIAIEGWFQQWWRLHLPLRHRLVQLNPGLRKVWIAEVADGMVDLNLAIAHGSWAGGARGEGWIDARNLAWADARCEHWESIWTL